MGAHFSTWDGVDTRAESDVHRILPHGHEQVLGFLGFGFAEAARGTEAADHVQAKLAPFAELNAQVALGNGLAKAARSQVRDGLDVHVGRETEFLRRGDGLLGSHEVLFHTQHLAQDVFQVVKIHLAFFADVQLLGRKNGHKALSFAGHAAARESGRAVDGAAIEALFEGSCLGAANYEVDSKGKEARYNDAANNPHHGKTALSSAHIGPSPSIVSIRIGAI